MHPKKFALIGGIFMVLLGVLALIPSLNTLQSAGANLPTLRVEDSYGLFLGYFPMNIFNKLALIVFGFAGMAAANAPTTNLPKSILFARVIFFGMGALAILGLITPTNTLNGYWPLFGFTILEHAVFALIGAYFGYALPSAAKQINERNEKSAPIKQRAVKV